MRETVIVEAVRTPVGKRNGGLSGFHAADLSALVLNALVERAGISPDIIDDVVWGCVSQVGDQSSNIGRYSVLAAGWPEHIPGTTVNRACGSSQQALDFAVQAVMSGQQDVVVAGGVEVMSKVPLGAARATGTPYGPKVFERYQNFAFNQGISAEMIAQKWGFSRTRLDEYSVASHERAAAAQDRGAFENQMITVFPDPADQVDPVVADEGVRRGTTVEKLAGLKPAFAEDGVIHAGNSSQISDGAAALLVMTAEAAVDRVRNEHRARFAQARDPYIRERLHDFEDLANRLLRVLAEAEFFRVGGRELIRVDVRVVAATHQDLEALVEQGRFAIGYYHQSQARFTRTPDPENLEQGAPA